MSELARSLSPPSSSSGDAPDDDAGVTPPPDNPMAPPSAHSTEGGTENRLHVELQTLRDQVSERIHVLIESIEADLFDPLQSAAHEAAAIHEALVKASHFDQSVDQIDPDLRWQRVRDYRRDTMARVIDPLCDQLLTVEIGDALNDRWDAFWDDLASLPTTLHVSVTRPEPASLYQPSPEDSVLTVLRKRWVQLQRRLFHSPGDHTAPTQEIPLRHLAAFHLKMRLPEHLAPHEHTVYQQFARAVATFERAVTTWTHRLLDAERHLSRPTDYLDESGREAMPTDPDDTPPDPPADELSLDAVWASVHDEAVALNEQLYALATLDFDQCPSDLQHTVTESWSDLDADVHQAGSFLVDLSDRTISPDAPHDQRATATKAHWPDWYRQAANRLAFCHTLAALRDATERHCRVLVDQVLDTTLRPFTSLHTHAAQQLRTLIDDDAEALFEAPESRDTLARGLRDLRRRASAIVTDELLDELQAARLMGTLSDTLADIALPTEVVFDERPATFELHALMNPDAAVIAPEADTRTVDLQTIAQEHFDAFFQDALRDKLHPFQDRLEALLTDAKELPTILQYNLDAAQDELDHAEGADHESVTAAQELTLNGLTRTAEAAEAAVRHGHDAVALVAPPVSGAYREAWINLHDRARVESRIREHLLELRTLVSRETQDAAERAEQRFRAARIRFQRALRLGRWRAEELVQRGRSAVGAASASEDDFLATIETLAHTDQALSDLPLVYRRLFAGRALTDPSLLAGRQNDLLRIQRHIEQWQRGLTNALVISGHHGSGLTSFLNVVQRTCLQQSTVHWFPLNERLRTESEVAEHLAHALRLSFPRRDGDLTLGRVRDHLLDRPRPSAPRVCFVEHLEHLYLRTVNGMKLADRMLTFMSRTDSRILWIGTISNQAWQLLDRSASAVSGLVLHHALAPIDRPELEALILARHQRSGLQLHFDSPEDPSPLLRQRLRKSNTEADTQTVLRSHYFDRLHTQCGSNIALALFYWVRSVEHDEEAMAMHVRPAKDLNFGFLERFSMQQAFVLQSLLDHGTLTIEEYSEISQLPDDTCLELFESLGNALLIEPTTAAPQDTGSLFVTVDPGRRYRLRPLVIHPVMKHLQSRNILH
jgi:hypothetical protein